MFYVILEFFYPLFLKLKIEDYLLRKLEVNLAYG